MPNTSTAARARAEGVSMKLWARRRSELDVIGAMSGMWTHRSLIP